MDITKWFNWYSFDVIGDLGFGKSFGMLDSGSMHWAIQILQDGMDTLGLYLPLWAVRLLLYVFRPSREIERFSQFFIDQLHNRMNTQGKQDVPDISHYLIEHYNNSDQLTQKTLMPMLEGDTRLIIIAGSDTTAATLTYLFYYLTTIPGLQDSLLEELKKYSEDDGLFLNQKLQSAPILNACINETLRLHPPVPSGVHRKVPKGGVQVHDIWIPGDTVIQMPWFAMGRGK